MSSFWLLTCSFLLIDSRKLLPNYLLWQTRCEQFQSHGFWLGPVFSISKGIICNEPLKVTWLLVLSKNGDHPAFSKGWKQFNTWFKKQTPSGMISLYPSARIFPPKTRLTVMHSRYTPLNCVPGHSKAFQQVWLTTAVIMAPVDSTSPSGKRRHMLAVSYAQGGIRFPLHTHSPPVDGNVLIGICCFGIANEGI